MNRAFHLTSNLADTSVMAADAVRGQMAVHPQIPSDNINPQALATAAHYIQ
ncbi:hypothetical protein [Kineobactrum sediminis]|uniref:hypothetical protein n=1 Tax=Kineobactrum sediminis TaxID=1905677 RepID=UPI0012D830E8|nr:hypothetical protein [Kineobactrum sediminis]